MHRAALPRHPVRHSAFAPPLLGGSKGLSLVQPSLETIRILIYILAPTSVVSIPSLFKVSMQSSLILLRSERGSPTPLYDWTKGRRVPVEVGHRSSATTSLRWVPISLLEPKRQAFPAPNSRSAIQLSRPLGLCPVGSALPTATTEISLVRTADRAQTRENLCF